MVSVQMWGLHPSSPAPVPYGHKLAYNVMLGLLIIVRRVFISRHPMRWSNKHSPHYPDSHICAHSTFSLKEPRKIPQRMFNLIQNL